MKVSIIQPSTVSSGGAERAKVLFHGRRPVHPLFQQFTPLHGTSIFDPVTPEEVAVALAGTIEQPDPPLRVPVGAPARNALEARKAAPEDAPFMPLTPDW